MCKQDVSRIPSPQYPRNDMIDRRWGEFVQRTTAQPAQSVLSLIETSTEI
jgi:hypothetical protein